MKHEGLIYLIAAGLFAATAGVLVGREGTLGAPAAALLVACLVMALMARRRPRAR